MPGAACGWVSGSMTHRLASVWPELSSPSQTGLGMVSKVPGGVLNTWPARGARICVLGAPPVQARGSQVAGPARVARGRPEATDGTTCPACVWPWRGDLCPGQAPRCPSVLVAPLPHGQRRALSDTGRELPAGGWWGGGAAPPVYRFLPDGAISLPPHASGKVPWILHGGTSVMTRQGPGVGSGRPAHATAPGAPQTP